MFGIHLRSLLISLFQRLHFPKPPHLYIQRHPPAFTNRFVFGFANQPPVFSPFLHHCLQAITCLFVFGSKHRSSAFSLFQPLQPTRIRFAVLEPLRQISANPILALHFSCHRHRLSYSPSPSPSSTPAPFVLGFQPPFLINNLFEILKPAYWSLPVSRLISKIKALHVRLQPLHPLPSYVSAAARSKQSFVWSRCRN